jgi:hypothetical protein
MRVMAMNDLQVTALHMLASLYLGSGRADKALQILAGVDAIAPGRVPIMRSLALAQLRAGRGQAAFDTAGRLAALGPQDEVLALLMARARAAANQEVA